MNKIYKGLCFLGLILSLWTIYFCAQNPASLQNTDIDIFGSWAWYITITVYPPGIFTPSSAGYSITYAFSKDSTYLKYKNDDVIEQGSFKIKYDKRVRGLDSCDVISFINGDDIQRYDNLSTHPDTLILRYRATDTPYEKYFRVK